MNIERPDQQEGDLPSGLPKPARRALVGAGYVRLDQFTGVSEDEILKLHGMGPKALEQIRGALAARGQSFTTRPSSPRVTRRKDEARGRNTRGGVNL